MSYLSVLAGVAAGMTVAAGIGLYLLRHSRRERIHNQAKTYGGDLWASG